MKKHKIFLFFFVLFAFCYLLIMPNFVILRSDDFGYIESIILTYKNRRLTTSDWLEPFSAFFTLVSLSSYLATKNFFLSTWGVLFAFSLINFLLIYILLSKKINSSSSAVLTFVICTFPLFFTKSLDFVGLTPSLTFALLSLLLYESKKHFFFFLSVFIGFSIRQNSAALLILPAYDFIKKIIKHKKINFKFLAYLMLFLGLVIIFRNYINETYAQRFITNKYLADFFKLNFSKRVFLVGAFINLSLISLFNLLLCQKSPFYFLKQNITKTIHWPIGLSLLFAAVITKSFQADKLHLIYIEALSPVVTKISIQWTIAVVIFISIWLLNYKLIKIHRYLTLLAAFVFLTALKKMIWDYYLLEIFIISLLFVVENIYKKDPNFYKNKFKFKNFAVIILALILIINFKAGRLYKVMLDIDKLKILRLETLLREDKIYQDELEGAPFGYLGWKFFNFRIGDGKAYIGQDFYHDYLKKGKIRFEILYSPWYKEFSKLKEGEQIIDSGSASIGFLDSKYRIVRMQEKTKIPIKNLENRFFPLSNREWNDYINKIISSE